jgi:hypothetical protein
MFGSRLFRIVVATSLALLPMQGLIEPQSDVAFARSAQCNVAAGASAQLYSGGYVGGANDNLNTTLGSYSDCLSAGQALAIQVSGNACGSYGAGQAYAVVEWHIVWDGTYQGQVNQQYDCGDV